MKIFLGSVSVFASRLPVTLFQHFYVVGALLQLSTVAMLSWAVLWKQHFFVTAQYDLGGLGETRTRDQRIKSPLL